MAIKFERAGEQELLSLFLDQLEKETDRGCALVAAGYLEIQLKNVLQGRMVRHKAAKEIFEFHGALATFSSKVSMAFLLGIVSHNVFVDLDRIRSIRNAFAHNLEVDSFSHVEVTKHCKLLENLQTSWVTSGTHAASRKKFIQCTMAISALLESCLVNGKVPRADRAEELETLKYWNEVFDI